MYMNKLVHAINVCLGCSGSSLYPYEVVREERQLGHGAFGEGHGGDWSQTHKQLDLTGQLWHAGEG